jgi:hypothetical protein
MVNGKALCGRWFAAVGEALDQLESAPTQQDAPARKPGMTINADFEAAVKQMDEEAKARNPKHGPLPDFWDNKAPAIEDLGVIDESKFRTKTQKLLIAYYAKHGEAGLKLIFRGTTGKVAVDTLKAMLESSDAGRLIHVQAVANALRKLVKTEICGAPGKDV